MVHTGSVVSRKEQAARSRATLIEVGRRLFVERGYDATSVSAILAEAKMARGGLYHHFPDGKQGLFLAVVDEIDNGLHSGLGAIVESDRTSVEKILAGFKLLLDLAADREFARVVLIEADALMPGAWAQGSEYQLLRASLAQAIADGEIIDVPLDATASSLYGAARRSADFVARSAKPTKAARESYVVLENMVAGFRTP